MVKINQNLHRLQVAWRDAQQSSSPAADNLREQFERLMTIYLSTKTAMSEPQMLQNCLNLQVSVAVLLVQLAIGNEGSQLMELTFPLPDGYSSLAYVPGELALPETLSASGTVLWALRMAWLEAHESVPGEQPPGHRVFPTSPPTLHTLTWSEAHSPQCLLNEQ